MQIPLYQKSASPTGIQLKPILSDRIVFFTDSDTL